MKQKDLASQSQRRAIQYWYVDGSYELGFGLLCLLLAAYFYAEIRLQGSWLSALVDGSLILVFIAGAAMIRWLTKKLKERITFPRTGYVAYRRERGLKRGWRIILALVTGGLVGATTAILVTWPFENFDIMPVISGLLMGFILVILAWRTALPRLYLLAGLSALIGLGLAFARLGNSIALSAFYAILAMLLIVSGFATLVIYLRQNPAPQEE